MNCKVRTRYGTRREVMPKYAIDKKVNGLRKYNDHAKGYYLHYKVDGHSSFRDKKIAPLDAPIVAVRNKAKKMLGMAVQGIDPFTNKSQPTFADIWQAYVDDMENRGVKRINYAESTYKKYLQKPLGNKLISEIKRGDIKRIHDNVSKSYKYQANRIIDLIRATFNNAIALSLIEVNPAKFVKKNKEEKRKRYLTQQELNAVVCELNLKSQEENGRWMRSVSFIWLCILTGARKGELAKAKWSNLQGNKIILEEHKTDKDGEARVIYLSSQAMNIINKLDQTDKYIIGINDPSKMWQGIRKRAGCPDVRIHDLRHSFASYARRSLTKLEETGNLLGHADLQSTQRYAHIFEEDSSSNAQAVGDYIQKLWMRKSG